MPGCRETAEPPATGTPAARSAHLCHVRVLIMAVEEERQQALAHKHLQGLFLFRQLQHLLEEADGFQLHIAVVLVEGKQKPSTSAAPGLSVHRPKTPRHTTLGGSTQWPWLGAQSLTLSRSGQSAPASCRAMGLAIARPPCRCRKLSTTTVISTTSSSASRRRATRLPHRPDILLFCMEHKAGQP